MDWIYIVSLLILGLLFAAFFVSVVCWFRLPKAIPFHDRFMAFFQWWGVGIPLSFGVVATFVLGPLVILTARPMKNAFGEFATRHTQRYINEGSSGNHVYLATPVRWLDGWNNYEDGLAGEPSGKHSARRAGQEYSFRSMYSWLIRNPFNKAKRTSSFFSCFPNGCDIEYFGTKTLSDKNSNPQTKGWQFVKAVDRKTARVYYGYRSIKLKADGTLDQVRFGFKLKPSHADQVQDADDLDKAFTLRAQFGSEIN